MACFVPHVTQPRFLQSVTNTASCRLCCLSHRHGNATSAFTRFSWQNFCFHPFFHYGEGKKVVNIKEKSAVTLNEDETGDVDHINANAAAQ